MKTFLLTLALVSSIAASAALAADFAGLSASPYAASAFFFSSVSAWILAIVVGNYSRRVPTLPVALSKPAPVPVSPRTNRARHPLAA